MGLYFLLTCWWIGWRGSDGLSKVRSRDTGLTHIRSVGLIRSSADRDPAERGARNKQGFLFYLFTYFLRHTVTSSHVSPAKASSVSAPGYQGGRTRTPPVEIGGGVTAC